MQGSLSLTKIKSIIEQNKSGAREFAIVEGLHAVKHALRFKAKPELILTGNKQELLKLSQKLCPDIIPKLKQSLKEIKDFNQITNSKIRTGVLAIFPKPQTPSPSTSASVIPAQAGIHSSFEVLRRMDATQKLSLAKTTGFTVLLDSPRDLTNIGAVIRVCAAAGIKDLIITGDSNPWNARAIRAAAGLQFALNIIYTRNTEAVIPAQAGIHATQKLSLLKQKLPFISFDERGQELTPKLKNKIPPNSVLIFGSERDGISEQLKLNSDLIIRLPMQAGVSSLNLATSVSAALYSLKI